MIYCQHQTRTTMSQLPMQLPFPLTDTLLATVLPELGQGWAIAVVHCMLSQ
jgi:hypothetical protein